MKIIHQANIVGKMFTRDLRKVLDIITEFTLGTDAETWIKGLKCGRNAIQELQAHYDGPSEGSRRKKVARSDLRKIFLKTKLLGSI